MTKTVINETAIPIQGEQLENKDTDSYRDYVNKLIDSLEINPEESTESTKMISGLPKKELIERLDLAGYDFKTDVYGIKLTKGLFSVFNQKYYFTPHVISEGGYYREINYKIIKEIIDMMPIGDTYEKLSVLSELLDVPADEIVNIYRA